MKRFDDVIDEVWKALVQGPIGAEDMNAGDEFIQEPDKHYGRERYEDEEELDKSVIPQHYVPAYGRVKLLYKALPHFGAVIKADDTIKDEYTDRDIVVAGYASPQVIDREKHLIQKEGMVKDLPRFLAEPMFANAMILHSNVQVGVVLPEWTHPETGKVYKTNVDDIGLFVLIKIRTDRFRPKIVDKVIEDIEKGNLKAFSISGDAPVESREHKCTDGQCFWVIPSIEFYEITICEEGVNQDAKLMVLSKATQDCPDGLCGLIRKQPVPEGVNTLDAPNPIPVDAVETQEDLSERVGEVAAVVGEAEAIELVENAEDAAKKLEKVNTGSGLGSGGSGDANTMADFGKPYDRETAMKGGDPLIDHFFQAYRKHLAHGASPEDSYFKLLDEGADGQPAPPWFGTREDKFRQFLIMANRSGLPIPTVRLRVMGNREGEIAADPSLTAWDLLQTAQNKMRGMVDKADSTLSAVAESKIHEAYTRAMDGIYRLGHLTREERIDLSSAITVALEAFHDEIGDMGDLDIPAEDVALLMKATDGAVEALSRKFHDVYQEEAKRQGNVRHADSYDDLDEDVKEFDRVLARYVLGALGKHRDRRGSTEHHQPGHHAEAAGADKRAWEKDFAALDSDGRIEEAKRAMDASTEPGLGSLDQQRRKGLVQRMLHRMSPEEVRSLQDRITGKMEKHRDKMGSTAHHKTGSPQGGIAQPPQTAPRERDIPEERVKTLTALVKERNMNGAELRLNPGYRNQPYSVNGLDELRQPVRLVGSVADVTAELAAGKAEMEERKVDNYAVPVEVGVQDVKIYEGDDVDPMEMVREQVAAASFVYAVATVLKHHRGIRGRDFLMDEKQQVEPENVSVMGGIRDSQTGHANTQIVSETDIQDIAGVGQEFEQAPEGHGIGQQGSVHPPRGVQGDGRRPEFVQGHEEEHEMRAENEGMPLAPNADDDSRGAPVAGNRGKVHHRSHRP